VQFVNFALLDAEEMGVGLTHWKAPPSHGARN